MRAKDSPTGHTAAEVDAARLALRRATVDLEAVDLEYGEEGRLTAATVESLIEKADVVLSLTRPECHPRESCEVGRLVLEEQRRRLERPALAADRVLGAAMFSAGWPDRWRAETLGSVPSLGAERGQPLGL